MPEIVGAYRARARRTQRGYRPGLAAMVGLLAIGFLFALRGGSSLSDDALVRETLARGAQAVQDHDLGALMTLVSGDYRDEAGLNRDRVRILALEAFRDQARTWVDLGSVSVRIEGDGADASAFVTVESRPRGSRDSVRWSNPITFRLKKEPGRRLLIFPEPRWRVVAVRGAGLSDALSLFD